MSNEQKTLRDEFAMAAMKASIEALPLMGSDGIPTQGQGGIILMIAEASYKMADAMLKAREAQ